MTRQYEVEKGIEAYLANGNSILELEMSSAVDKVQPIKRKELIWTWKSKRQTPLSEMDTKSKLVAFNHCLLMLQKQEWHMEQLERKESEFKKQLAECRRRQLEHEREHTEWISKIHEIDLSLVEEGIHPTLDRAEVKKLIQENSRPDKPDITTSESTKKNTSKPVQERPGLNERPEIAL